MAATYKAPVDDNVPWEQRLANYGQNTNAGMDEYKRALGVARSKKALGDTAGYDAANKWAGQVDTAIGGIGSRPGSETRSALETWKTNSQKPTTPWTFDANNNQAYQEALKAAGRSAQTAGNNATVRLGSRGVGNSQQALTTENQIQQRSVADVNSNILPQLMSQDYTRYRDGIQDQQKQNDSLYNYATSIGNLDQQDFNNNRLIQSDERQVSQDARQKKMDNIAIQQWYEQQYGVPIEAKDDWKLVADQVKGMKPLATREYEDRRSDTTFNQGIQTKQLDNSTRSTNASIANMGADNVRAIAAEARQKGDKELAVKFDIWEKTGVAPDGIPGVQPGTPIKDKNSSSSSKVDPKESANNYGTILGDLSADGVTREQAMQLAQANSPYLTDADYRKLLDTIQKQF